MKLRIIDDRPFIVIQKGKRETVLTPDEIVEQATLAIDAAKKQLPELANRKLREQDRLEDLLISGCSTRSAKQALIDLGEMEAEQHSAIDEAKGQIDAVFSILDSYRADQILRESQEQIAALCKPFDDFLGENK